MIRDKYAVRLAPEQREELQNLIRVGKSSARVTARARILLKSNDGWAAPKVAEALDVALGTVYRIKQRRHRPGLPINGLRHQRDQGRSSTRSLPHPLPPHGPGHPPRRGPTPAKEVRPRTAWTCRAARDSNPTGSPLDGLSSPDNGPEMDLPELPLPCTINVLIAQGGMDFRPPRTASPGVPVLPLDGPVAGSFQMPDN